MMKPPPSHHLQLFFNRLRLSQFQSQIRTFPPCQEYDQVVRRHRQEAGAHLLAVNKYEVEAMSQARVRNAKERRLTKK